MDSKLVISYFLFCGQQYNAIAFPKTCPQSVCIWTKSYRPLSNRDYGDEFPNEALPDVFLIKSDPAKTQDILEDDRQATNKSQRRSMDFRTESLELKAKMTSY
eukprot:g33360.t1